MIDALKLSSELRPFGAAVCVGWKEPQNEPNGSYHTKDGKIVRLIWPSPPTTQQIADADAIIQAHDGTPPTQHQIAIALAAAADAARVVDRAVALSAKDSDNVLRKWTRDFRSAVAAATSLADLKTRVAALPALDALSAAEAKAAIVDKINSSEAD